MFTWICSDCGNEVDISKTVCPNCKPEGEVTGLETIGTPELGPGEIFLPPKSLALTPEQGVALKKIQTEVPPKTAEPRLKQSAASPRKVEPIVIQQPPPTVIVQQSATAPPPPPPPQVDHPQVTSEITTDHLSASSGFSGDSNDSGQAFQFRRGHLVLFVVGALLVVFGVFYMTGKLDQFFGALQFENPPEMESLVETFAIGVQGDIEVSGIRPYYTDDYESRVRVYVANHSSQQQSVALRAHLRNRQAGERTPPLASFNIILPDPLMPEQGKELDLELRAMGTLQSLSPWEEIRVDLEQISSEGSQ